LFHKVAQLIVFFASEAVSMPGQHLAVDHKCSRCEIDS
jgi:hypothetical protein